MNENLHLHERDFHHRCHFIIGKKHINQRVIKVFDINDNGSEN